ncbi:hypothetical protein FB45DRAFT_893754 [Roridomyces roridus]|uniref:Uncharacterized protein n=1 Tax=Roridomyces roridus TaxID=1738132 RepID=A0AAD7G0Q0_9AGAR|nr:hypothetical protein FB45DRAFT_893754 [Roridomyces roridus]
MSIPTARLASRLASRRLLPATRRYSTAEPEPKKSGSNTTLYLVAAAALAGGAYYYYSSNPDQAAALKAEEEQVVKHAKAMKDSAIAAGHDNIAAARKEAESARDRVIAEADARAHQVATQARGALDSARSSTENLYNDARKTGDKASGKAQRTWAEWLGWGSAKKEEGKEKLDEAAAGGKAKLDQAAAKLDSKK